MSELKKWMKLMESVPPIMANGTDQSMRIKRDATVMVSPKVGGGTGRFMDYTPGGAMIDIKGVPVELSEEDFSLPERDYQDPYQSGNEWFHVSQEPNTIGTQKDKPEFRPGDMVQVDNVYGSVIGPGIGIFIAYSTTGNECIVSFDDKEMVIPTENVGACLEQDAKNNFDEMDNDGNLSPMSLGSQNVKIEQEPAMDQRSEFSKWLGTVEEALNGTPSMQMPESGDLCGCNDWQCPKCFPDDAMGQPPQPAGSETAVVVGGQDMGMDLGIGQEMGGEGGACPMCGHDSGGEHDHSQAYNTQHPSAGGMDLDNAFNDIEFDEMPMEEVPMLGDDMVDEEDMDFEPERPKSGKGVKLGDIVQKFVKSGERDTDGEDSPLTYGEDNLAEVVGDDEQPDDFGHSGFDDMGSYQDEQDAAAFGNPSDNDIESAQQMALDITNLQNLGMSQSSHHYTEQEFQNMTPDQMRKAHSDVTGNDGSAAMVHPGNSTVHEGNSTMENVDQDIMAMLKSLKVYDKLTESVAPVLGMRTLGEKDEGKHNNGKTTGFNAVVKAGEKEYGTKKAGEKVAGAIHAKMAKAGKLEEADDDKLPAFLRKGKADDKGATDKRNEKSGADVWKNPRDSKKKEVDENKDFFHNDKLKAKDQLKAPPKEVKVKESTDQPDPEVLEWMARFSKLGNMKGYGR